MTVAPSIDIANSLHIDIRALYDGNFHAYMYTHNHDTGNIAASLYSFLPDFHYVSIIKREVYRTEREICQRSISPRLPRKSLRHFEHLIGSRSVQTRRVCL